MRLTPLIVLVDDDEMHLVVAKRAIVRLGIEAEVLALTSGHEVLRILESGGVDVGRIAVIMLDLALPDLSGWKVLERIRGSANLHAVPVVVVTSSDHPEDVSRAYELGANSYLVKRHDPERPGNYLAQAARYWVEHSPGSQPAS